MKKFMKKTEGFTLVELIVVIAILGILAGVGTVGYSGYIKKANQAKDIQIISQIKSALELAGYDSTADLQEGSITLSSAAPVIAETGGETIKTALVKYFGSEEALENLTLSFDWEVDEDVYTDVATNYTSESGFYGNEGKLLKDVQALTDRFEEFTNQAGELESYAGHNFTGYLDKIGASSTDKQQVANSAATYVAMRTHGIDKDTFMSAWNNPGAVAGNFQSVTSEDGATLGMMGGLAALYARGEALVTYLDKQRGNTPFVDPEDSTKSYASMSEWFSAQKIEGNTTSTVATSVGNIYNKVAAVAMSSEYQAHTNTYFAGGQAAKDGKAYLAAMGAINNSADVLTSDLNNNRLYTDGKAETLLKGYVAAAGSAADGVVVIQGIRDAAGTYAAVAVPGDV